MTVSGLTTPLRYRFRAVAFAAGGAGKLVEQPDAIPAANDRSREELLWIDLLALDHDRAREILLDQLGFHELLVEDAISDLERPTLQQVDDVLFFVLPALVPSKEGERFVEVGFFVRGRLLVTVAAEQLTVIDGWYERMRNECSWSANSPSRLLHALVDSIVDDYFPALDALEDEVEDTADAIFAGDTNRVRTVLNLKRRFGKFRRTLMPVRDVMNSILRRDMEWIEERDRPYFQDVFDHILRLTELVDVNRDTLTSMLDVHLSTVSNNLNNVMKKMTVISTVLMTMALVAGIYGMNFEHMPELHWKYGYEFAWGLMLFLGAAILVVFKSMDWL